MRLRSIVPVLRQPDREREVRRKQLSATAGEDVNISSSTDTMTRAEHSEGKHLRKVKCMVSSGLACLEARHKIPNYESN